MNTWTVSLEAFTVDCDNMDSATFLPWYLGRRRICDPPMVKLFALEIGDLWYDNGLSLAILACMSESSLLVTYSAFDKTREPCGW